jgi:hypothetical protein
MVMLLTSHLPPPPTHRTDFSCCPKEPHYGYYSEGEHGDFTGLAFNDKVGTCDCKSHSQA